MIQARIGRCLLRCQLGMLLTVVVFIGACGPRQDVQSARTATGASSRQVPLADPAHLAAASATNTPGAVAAVQPAVLVLPPAARAIVEGSGFAAREPLDVSLSSAKHTVTIPLATTKADAHGNMTTLGMTVPTDLSPGPYLVVVTGVRSRRIARALLRIQRVPPTVQLDAYSGQPGYEFGVAGNGFAPNEDVGVYLGATTAVPLAAFRAGDGGNLSGRITVPMRPAGDYPMYFVGRVSDTPTSVEFNIRAFKPWVTLERYGLPPGTSVSASGSDFAPGERVQVYLNRADTSPLTVIQVDSHGTFTHVQALRVLGSQTGQQTLIFVGERSRVGTTASFEVLRSPATVSQQSQP